MTLASGDGPATSGALMVNDPDNGSAASVLIPSRLYVEGATPEGLPFGDTVLLGDDGAPGTALADTLDVIVDDTWQVSDQMLEQLVNAVDGVLVDVDVDVVDGQQASSCAQGMPSSSTAAMRWRSPRTWATRKSKRRDWLGSARCSIR